MPTPPSVAPLAGALADIATDLRRGSCCLVVCDKGWTLPIYTDLRERLRAANVRCGYLDGRPTETAHADLNAMLIAVGKIRWAARADEMAGVVFAIPYLDIMASIDGGWNTISRDVVPLLYENPTTVWLGFQDPTLPLLPIVEKVFGKRHVIDTPYRASEPAPAPESPPLESAKPEDQKADLTSPLEGEVGGASPPGGGVKRYQWCDLTSSSAGPGRSPRRSDPRATLSSG